MQEKNLKYKLFLKENTVAVIFMIIAFTVANIVNTVVLKSYDKERISMETIPFSTLLVIAIFSVMLLSIIGVAMIAKKRGNNILKEILFFALSTVIFIVLISFVSGLLAQWLDKSYRTLSTTKSMVDNITLIVGTPIRAYLYCLFSAIVMEGVFKLNISKSFYLKVFILTLVMTATEMLFGAVHHQLLVLNIVQAIINTMFLTTIFIYSFSYDKARYSVRKK